MIVHVAMFVRALDAAKEFYSEKLGFAVVEDTLVRGPIVKAFSGGSIDTVRIALLSVSSAGTLIELVQAERKSEGDEMGGRVRERCAMSGGWISILVADLHSHITSLSQRGVYPASEIFQLELPGSGRSHAVFYRDPDGNGIEFLQKIR